MLYPTIRYKNFTILFMVSEITSVKNNLSKSTVNFHPLLTPQHSTPDYIINYSR